jgi:hypothetical protein
MCGMVFKNMPLKRNDWKKEKMSGYVPEADSIFWNGKPEILFEFRP